MMLAKDGSSVIRKSFIDKVNKLLKEHSIPKRYGCAFALASAGPLPDFQADPLEYLTEFFKEYNREPCICQNSSVQDKDAGSMTAFPAYIVVFLIHVLAHDQGFPSGNCQDEETYAKFCSPLIVLLQASVNPDFYDSRKFDINEIVSYIFGIFRAVKKAVDAVDAHFTSKLHCLSDIALLVMKKLTPNFKPPSHAPRLVLLPSSFYKVGYEASLHTESSIDEGFVERILLVAQSLFALPPIIDDKRVGKSHDHTVQLDVKKSNEKKLLQVEQAATLESKKKGEKPGAIGNRKKTEEMPLQKSDSDSTDRGKSGKNEVLVGRRISLWSRANKWIQESYGTKIVMLISFEIYLLIQMVFLHVGQSSMFLYSACLREDIICLIIAYFSWGYVTFM
ncbi:hypothetical protein Taro_011839 [Colocasia esculenta]|uniref:Uncharacterized protein n=1 Tax=Colocasia esculenta TaxID=4460 RepID=A0A843U2G3_COLES|nr:hypothetical protein [Colocasia esculenta]